MEIEETVSAQKGVFILDSVDLVASPGKLAAADKGELACHRRYGQGREAFAGDAVHGKVHEGQFETCSITFEGIAASACDLDSSLDVYHVKFLHQGIVVEWLEVEGGFLAPVPDGYVVVFVFTDGGAGIRDIGHEIEQLLACFFQLM